MKYPYELSENWDAYQDLFLNVSEHEEEKAQDPVDDWCKVRPKTNHSVTEYT